MNEMRFVDTSILIYAVSAAPEDTVKQGMALRVLSRRDLAMSTQVLGEFYVQAVRPSRRGALNHNEARDFITSLQRFHIQTVNLDVVDAALAFCNQFGLSYWDSAILAAARLSGCSIVYSEDLSPRQDYDGLRVVNPFAGFPQGAPDR